MDVKLYVGNLAYATSEIDLRTLFTQAGNVTGVSLITDRDTGRSKGFAFVTMSTQSEAEKAIGMFNAFTVHERELTVNVARPREERPNPRGRGGAFGDSRGSGPRR